MVSALERVFNPGIRNLWAISYSVLDQTGAVVDSACGTLLAQTDSCGVELLECDETISNLDAGHVLGEAPDGCAKTLHALL